MSKRLTRSAMLLLALSALLCLARVPARAQESGLALELSMLRQSWLHDDDATAIARLDTLRQDNRLSGQLPRWLAAMRAALALNAGDTETAAAVLQPLLEQTQDAREHVRAIRLAMAFGHTGLALEFARHGRARAPQSTVLATLEAELLLLQGDVDGALAAWRAQTGADPRPAYPHVPPQSGGWANVRPWNVAENAVRPAPPVDNERPVRRGESPAAPGYSPEPFVSLFMPVHWYSSVQPGLDRCLHELAANPVEVQAREAALEALCEAAQQAQKRFENFRGELAERNKLVVAAAEARFDAVCAVRIVAQHQLSMAQSEKAEATAQKALALDPDNIACNDLLAQAYAGQGKAEEARVGPLGRLKASAGLSVSMARIYTPGPYSQAADRVFAPALALFRVNGQSGRDQFKKLRASFGDANNENGIPAEALGLWLFLKGEKVTRARNVA
jgi:tetratricopeptide (TPR) repeat protein